MPVFDTDAERLEHFKKWLEQLIGTQLLNMTEEELWRRYAEAGYEKGAGRAFQDAVPVPPQPVAPVEGDISSFYRGTRDQFLRDSFAHPVSTERIKVLAGRSFGDLKNVTTDMATKLHRVLMDGLVKGQNPRDVAREMKKQVGISRERAQLIAQTEIIRAHAEGQLDTLERLGVEEVGAAVEFATAGETLKGTKVCPKCTALQGVVLKVNEARGVIPVHPRCRCAWMPAGVGESTKGQKLSKTVIEKAFKRAGMPKRIDSERPTRNVFCPTGQGGGRDPSCSPGGDRKEAVRVRVSEVIRKMSPIMARTLSGRQMEVITYDTVEELQKSGNTNSTHAQASYDRHKGQLHVAKDVTPEVLAHEIGHVLDGPTRSISSDPSFQRAAKKDAKKLSDYAQTLPDEALAELLRIRFTEGPAAAKKKAPAMVKALASLGYRDWDDTSPTANVFCPTGEGGGRDPSCGRGSKRTTLTEGQRKTLEQIRGIKEYYRKDFETRKAAGYFDDLGGEAKHSEWLLRAVLVQTHKVSAKDLDALIKKGWMEERATDGYGTELRISNGSTNNVFCATGTGGGIDPSCSPSGSKHKVALRLHKAISESGVDADKITEYTTAVSNVTSRMPAYALQRMDAHLLHSYFYGRTRDVGTESYSDAYVVGEALGYPASTLAQIRETQEKAKKGFVSVGGAVVRTAAGEPKYNLYLDGHLAGTTGGAYGQGDRQHIEEVYAHEFMHLVDGPRKQISSSTRWLLAYGKEIGPQATSLDGPALSGYAHTSAFEGLAEFGRLLYGGKVDLSRVEKDFPECSRFMKDAKLWPGSIGEAQTSTAPRWPTATERAAMRG